MDYNESAISKGDTIAGLHRRFKGGSAVNRKSKTELPIFHNNAEQISEQAQNTVAAYEASLQNTFVELAECESASAIPEDLREKVEGEIASLHRASTTLLGVQGKVAALEDELSARLKDVKNSVDRKWYRANPPSNTYIDQAEQKNHHFAQGLNLYKLALILVVGSFAGVVIELLWCLFRNGYIESRSGLVYGPFNLLYGVGAAVLSLALYRFRNRGKWLSFLGGFLVGSVVEYVCSWFLEVAYGSASWDYSNMPFNLNGRICLLYSIFWGCLGILWIKDIYPRMSKWILKLPNHAGKIITWVLIVFMVLNCAVSGIAVWRWSDRVKGIEASNRFEAFIDARFPDERMERVYANMSFQ